MQIRITVPVLPYGNVQLLRGQVFDVPEQLALEWVEREEAALVPFAEQATLPRPRETAVVPRTFSKPKPPSSPAKGRR